MGDIDEEPLEPEEIDELVRLNPQPALPLTIRLGPAMTLHSVFDYAIRIGRAAIPVRFVEDLDGAQSGVRVFRASSPIGRLALKLHPPSPGGFRRAVIDYDRPTQPRRALWPYLVGAAALANAGWFIGRQSRA